MYKDGNWIALYRNITKWEWYQDSNVMSLWIHLLLMASHEGSKWQGQTIERGQLITGLHRLKKDLGMSIQSIRTALNKLKSTNEITIESTNKNSIITITNYEHYNPKDQPRDPKATSKSTNEQQTNNKPSTTLKNVKNEKKKEKDLFSLDSTEIWLANGLFKMMKANNIKHREPNKQQWASDFDLMIRVDDHDSMEIAELIKWTQKHHFWKNNIQSPAKLRKQFARLFGEMRNDKDWSGNHDGNDNNGCVNQYDGSQNVIEPPKGWLGYDANGVLQWASLEDKINYEASQKQGTS